MANFKTFCVLPFNQIVARTHGRLSPCCHNLGKENLNQMSIKDYWSSDNMTNIRKKMLSGEDVAGCHVCYSNETVNGNSMRLDGLNYFSITKDTNIEEFVNTWQGITFPERIEVHAGNFCNLKCLSCNPWDSSALLAENRVLKFGNNLDRDFEISDKAVDEIFENLNNSNIRQLDLRGGESLLVPKIRQMLQSLDDKIYKQVVLRIQTNTTYISDTWKEIFSKFKQVIVSSSIDAIGEQLRYIRYPADWQDIQENLFWYKSQPNVRLNVGITVTNLNLLCVDQLIHWCIENEFEFKLNPTMYPQIFQPNNMPFGLLTIVKQKLQPLLSIDYVDPANLIVLEKLTGLEPLDDSATWLQFCRTIDARDAHRNNRIFDVMPEFKNFWLT